MMMKSMLMEAFDFDMHNYFVDGHKIDTDLYVDAMKVILNEFDRLTIEIEGQMKMFVVELNRLDKYFHWYIVVVEHHNNSSIQMTDRGYDKMNFLSMMKVKYSMMMMKSLVYLGMILIERLEV